MSSFNKEVSINLPFASISGVYIAAREMEIKNKFLPRYFNSYCMNSTSDLPTFSYDIDEYVFRIHGPTMKVYKMLLNPEFINTANELRRATISINDDTDEPTTLNKDVYSANISEYIAKPEDFGKLCPITQMEFKEGDIIAKTCCGHKFMASELNKYLLDYGNSCPMCRHEFK